MTDKIEIGLFEKLTLRDWYKYLLYVSGVLLILALFLDAKIDHLKIIRFSIQTIAICCFVWVFDTFSMVGIRYYDLARRDEEPTEGQIVITWIDIFVHFVAFIIWLFIARNLLL